MITHSSQSHFPAKMDIGNSLAISINLKPDEEITRKTSSLCLIGKVLLHRPLHRDEVESIAKQEWLCESDFSISYIVQNMFVFAFESKNDLNNVVGKSPWTIRGGLLVLSVWCSTKVPIEISLSYSLFWVQVPGLPIEYLTQENVCKIGECLGIFVCADNRLNSVFDGKFCWRKFVRLRVILDVRNPILTGFWLRIGFGLNDIWIDFKYEKLGQFCYLCGRIGYHYLSCRFSAGEAKFGPWLRALPFHGDDAVSSSANLKEKWDQRTTVIAVPKQDASLNLDISTEMETLESEEEDDIPTTPTRKSVKRFIFNNIDSMIMMINSAIIFLDASSANTAQSNWGLIIMMAAYLFHLTRKLIHVVWRSSYDVSIPTSADSRMALIEIVILLLLLLM